MANDWVEARITWRSAFRIAIAIAVVNIGLAVAAWVAFTLALRTAMPELAG